MRELLSQSQRSIIMYELDPATNQAILWKICSPAKNAVSELANEFDISQSIAVDGIRKPLRRGLYQNKEAFAYSYFDGVSLRKRLSGQTLPLQEALAIAVSLSKVLKKLHQQGVFHLRLNSHHVLYQASTGAIQLIDFSLASRQPISQTLDFQDWGNELAYVAPEQMGRWGQVADNRTDLYSFGVILYELLTGQLPFVDDDLAKLVHYHLVRLPNPPHLINERIPLMLSKIVEKLLSKRPDERYQTTHGVLQDLQQCADDLKQALPIQLTELGRFDGSGHLQFSGHLYGRQDAIHQAIADLEQVTEGQKRLYLVSGDQGAGKTALINQLKKRIQDKNLILLTTYGEPSDQVSPYRPFLLALRELATTLIALPDKDLLDWQTTLKTTIGGQQPVLTKLIPEFHWILEPNRSMEPIPNQVDSFDALPGLFETIVGGLVSLSLPIVLVMEDIHWADAIVWSSLENICRDATMSRLLLVLTTQPTASNQILVERLRSIRAQIPAGHSVELTNLTSADIHSFISDSLSTNNTESLSQVVYTKTAGNPYFLRQFLTARFTDKTLWFNAERLHWAWDMDRVMESSPTSNVVEQVIDRLTRLSPEQTQILQLAACYGMSFTVPILVYLSTYPASEVNRMLSTFVTGQLLIKTGEDYRFSHEQIRKAVYDSAPEAERSRLHYEIAQFLSSHDGGVNPPASVYDLATHYTLGSAQLPESARFFIVELNLKAGLAARQAANFQLAYGYLLNGIRLLTEADWSAQYETALQLYNQATEIGMITGAYDEAEHWLQESLRRSKTIDDRIKAHEVKLNQFSKNHQFAETIAHLLTVLEEIGHGVPRHPSKLAILWEYGQVTWYLRNKSIATIPKMPLMKDERAMAFLKVVVNSATSVYAFAPELAPLLYFRCIRLSLQYGLSEYAPFSFMGYAHIQLFFGNIRKGIAFGQMALQLADQLEANEVRAKVMVIFYGFLSYWQASLRESIEPLRKAYLIARQNGDLQYAAFALSFRSTIRLHAGDNLVELLTALTDDNQLILEMNQPLVHAASEGNRQTVLRLVQGTANQLSMQGEDFDEAALFARLDALGDQATKFDLYFYKLMLACLFNHYTEAYAASELARQYEDESNSRQAIYPSFLLFSCIACIKQVRNNPSDAASGKLKKQIAKKIKLMRSFGKEAPQNYEHKHTLLMALWHEDQGSHATTAEYYQTAIAQAKRHNFIHEQAIAQEHFARFLLQTGQDEHGIWMLQKAFQNYQRWGAVAKCNQLEKEYPQMILELATAGKKLTIASFQDRYDLAAIIQANQMLSSENTLDGLLRRMVEIVIQNASVTNVVILLKGPDQQLVPKAAGTNLAVHIVRDADTRIPYSESVVQYVIRTGTGFVSQNLLTDSQLIPDAYTQLTRPLSVCCLPINTQNSFLGMLYLENNMAQAVFDAKRVDFFATISSQLAISLDNVFLYEEMEAKVQQRTHDLEQSLRDLKVTQTQLIQREKMASLGELTAGIAHEIQNPLNFVNNFSEVSAELVDELDEVLDKSDTEEAKAIARDLRQNLQKINQHGGRASSIVKGMLEHSRASSGERQPTNLNALADEYLRLAYQGQRTKDKRFTCELITNFEPALPLVEVVPAEIGRVLLNLYNNAFYAVQQRTKQVGDEYKPTVRVTTLRVENGVQLSVSDNGTGIPEGLQQKVFQPFFTTKPTGEGTGLGLSLSYDMITKGHRGSLTLASQSGIGSTFVIELPQR